MKNFKTFVLIILIGFNFTMVKAQTVNEHLVEIPEKNIPKEVIRSFRDLYPNITMRTWYTTHISYWYSDYRTDWYGNWYENRVVVESNFQQPNYYEVNFLEGPGEVSRAMFNKYGFWYETRTQLTMLPQNVQDALAKTQYADWKRSRHKEKIEAPGWPLPVYRFRVTKGIKSKIIRIDDRGNIIQEREIYE